MDKNVITDLEGVIVYIENDIEAEGIKNIIVEVKSVTPTGVRGILEDAIYNIENERRERAIECIYDAITVIEMCAR